MAMAAAPAQAGTAPDVHSEYCVVVLGKAPSPGAASPEVYRHCSAQPFDSAAQLNSSEARSAGVVSPASSTHLVRVFQDNNYKGQWWDYYGDAGPCDSAGYRWDPDDWWSSHLSSIEKGYNSNCNHMRLYSKDKKHSQVYGLSTPQIGPYYNDNTYRTQIYS
jgi:hypothetical protein